MEQLTTFMLGVWREASRHIEITEFAATLLTMLAPSLPIARLVIRRIDQERSRLETVAIEPSLDDKPPSSDPVQWSAKDIARLLRWSRSGQLDHQLGSKSNNIALAALPS